MSELPETPWFVRKQNGHLINLAYVRTIEVVQLGQRWAVVAYEWVGGGSGYRSHRLSAEYPDREEPTRILRELEERLVETGKVKV